MRMRTFFDKTRTKIALLCAIVILVSGVMVGLTQFYTNISATSWGLSYPNNGSEPYIDIEENYLAKYKTYYRGDKTKPNIYLTFDAGYDNGNTGKILDILKHYNVKACFFLAGYFFESQPELVKRMVQEGHTVGNHTNNHKNMSKMDKATFIKEIEAVEKMYFKLIGKEIPKYYRPPEGRYNEENLKWISERGYKTIFWSLTHKDWDPKNQPNAQQSIQLLTKRMHNGAIVLMHSVSDTDVKILGELIESYTNSGYKIRPITSL